MKSFDNVFLTGCDQSMEWMLPWFISNYRQHTKIPLVFANFGVSEHAENVLASFCGAVIDMTNTREKGWLKKPQAMIEASKLSNKVCWVDTDCHILKDVSGIFNLIQPNRLAMVEDKPWSKRRGETWHNTGVVAFENQPQILKIWIDQIKRYPAAVGDQEVLHVLLKEGLNRQIHTTTLPDEYNWLRLMVQDGLDSKHKKIMHWTGPKGKQTIKEMIDNDQGRSYYW